jgi:xanthine dehydrogenase molybdopterin-binding subunit B
LLDDNGFSIRGYGMRYRDKVKAKIAELMINDQEITCEIAERREEIAALETEREYVRLEIMCVQAGYLPHRSGKRC